MDEVTGHQANEGNHTNIEKWEPYLYTSLASLSLQHLLQNRKQHSKEIEKKTQSATHFFFVCQKGSNGREIISH